MLVSAVPGADRSANGGNAARASAAVSGAAESDPADEAERRSVDVWLFVGVNGVGKTTTVGKVASQQAGSGSGWSSPPVTRSGPPPRSSWQCGPPGSAPRVVGRRRQRSQLRRLRRRPARRRPGSHLVLGDTAGRLHTKVNLMEELKKVRRVADRPPGHVSEVLLVIDATTGQNGLPEAKQFTEAVDVSGVVLTKLDGTAKGGIVVAIQRELGTPVKLVGLGEGRADLVDFDPVAFVDASWSPSSDPLELTGSAIGPF